MRIASLAVLLSIAVLQADAALCIEEEAVAVHPAKPAPIMMCRLSMFEDDDDSTTGDADDAPAALKRPMHVKRPAPRRAKVADNVLHEDARREDMQAPIKEPHAPGVYSYADSDSRTSSEEDLIGEIVIQSHPTGIEVESGTGPTDVHGGNVEEENEHQQADGEIEYSTCEAGGEGTRGSDKQLLMAAGGSNAQPGMIDTA